jgi:hypothetical protein
MSLLRSSRGNHISESREGLVDVLSLLQSLTRGTRFVDPLRPRQVDQVELSSGGGPGDLVLGDDGHGEHHVGSGRVLVHVGAGLGPRGRGGEGGREARRDLFRSETASRSITSALVVTGIWVRPGT